MSKGLIFISDQTHYYYQFQDNTITEYRDNDNLPQTPIIVLSDSFVDLKIIQVPVVSNQLLPDIILNSLKKHSAVLPQSQDFDFLIQQKEENQYHALTFTKTYQGSINLQGKKIFSVYHILIKISKKRIHS